MFEIQKSGDKTSSGEIGIDIGTYASKETRCFIPYNKYGVTKHDVLFHIWAAKTKLWPLQRYSIIAFVVSKKKRTRSSRFDYKTLSPVC